MCKIGRGRKERREDRRVSSSKNVFFFITPKCIKSRGRSEIVECFLHPPSNLFLCSTLTLSEITDASSLKKLPIEVRNEIYELLVISDSFSVPKSLAQENLTPHAPKSYGLSPSILRTSHQVCEEGYAYFMV